MRWTPANASGQWSTSGVGALTAAAIGAAPGPSARAGEVLVTEVSKAPTPTPARQASRTGTGGRELVGKRNDLRMVNSSLGTRPCTLGALWPGNLGPTRAGRGRPPG